MTVCVLVVCVLCGPGGNCPSGREIETASRRASDDATNDPHWRGEEEEEEEEEEDEEEEEEDRMALARKKYFE